MTKVVAVVRGGHRLPLLLLACLLALVPLLSLVPSTAAASCTAGGQFDGLYYYVIVDALVTGPAGSGYVTRSRDGVDCETGMQSPAVEGGTMYFTGTRLPTMATGYATAPLDFYLTAHANEGYQFLAWSNCPGAWVNGNTVHVQYDETWCDAFQGWYRILAMFTYDKLTFNLKSSPGIIYDVPSGYRSVDPAGVLPIECHVDPAYAGAYEFGGWIGDYDTSYKIADRMAESTYIDLEPIGWWLAGEDFWVQPTLRLKGAATETLTTTVNDPEGGTVSDYSEVLEVNEPFLVWATDNEPDWRFVRWDTDEYCDVSSRYSEETWVWLLEEHAATLTAVFEEVSSVPDLVYLTMAVTGEGTTVPSEGEHPYLTNQTITIRAVPSQGYEFTAWMGLPNYESSSSLTEYIQISENTTVTAVFTETGAGGGGTVGPGSTASGVWGRFSESLSSVGLANTAGRMGFVVCMMVVGAVACRRDKALRIIVPVGILGIGIVANWVPIWIVVTLAIGLALGLLQFMRRKGATDGGD